VDDDRSTLAIIKNFLENLGYHNVGVVSTGEEAINTANEYIPDLVIMDINLRGDMDGIAVAQNIYNSIQSPTIFLTATVSEEVYQRAMMTRPFGFLRKPFDAIELRAAIATALYQSKIEKQLKISETRFRQLSDATFESVLILRKDIITETNNSVLEMFGYQPHELVGKRATDLFDSESINTINEIMDNIIDSPMELQALMKDGSTFTAEVRTKKIDLINETLTVIVVRNISEFKMTQDALKKSREEYRIIFENAGEAILIAQDGRFKFFNKNIPILTGYDHDELIDHSFIELIHPDDREHVYGNYKRRINGEKIEEVYRFRIINKKGKTIWVEINAIMIQWENRPATLNFLYDITNRVTAEAKLDRNLKAMDAANEGIAIIDRKSKFIYMNHSYATMHGYKSRENLCQKSWKDQIEEGERNRFSYEIMPSFWKNRYWSGTTIGLKTDGTQFPILLSLTAIEEGSFVSITRDISDLKEAECQRQELQEQLIKSEKMESLGLLAGGVAHDLNNILSPLVGYPDLILPDLPEGSRGRKRLERMRKAALEAVGVIQDLLTMARRGRYTMEPLNINGIIESYLDSPSYIEKSEEHPDIKLKLKLDRNIGKLNGSSTHLSQVIMNLVINAYDAMPDGGQLTIKTLQKNIEELSSELGEIKKGEYISLSIKDTGVGISPENKNKIFEPYFSTKKMGISGSGLGLAVVYGIIKDHKGYFDIISEINKGTEFLFYFPITQEKKKSASGNAELSGNENILIVDDIKEHRDIAEQLLTSLGYETDAVSNGKDALRSIAKSKPDIILLDINLENDFDGIETYKELAKVFPNQKVLFISGDAPDERLAEIRKNGQPEILKKPFTRNSLGTAIRQCLSPVQKVTV
ncbi:MAG: PAS domain S-box protein, partial [Candidatus Zixiibacteriota bacterium]